MSRPLRGAIAVLGVTTAALLGACSLDERTLVPGVGGGSSIVGSDGGAGSGGSSTSTGGGGAGTGGATGGAPASGSGGATEGGRGGVLGAAAGMGGAGGAAKEPCVYSDGVVAPGCETLVSNPGFQTNVAGWESELAEVAATWDASDAQGSKTSGSLAVTNRVFANTDGSGMAGAGRCLPTTGGFTYDFAVGLFIPGGQGQAGGAISVFFYDAADCSGTVKKSAVSSVESAVDNWKLVRLRDVAPATAKSMQVRLVAEKPFRQASLTVRFDNVLVQGNGT